MLSSLPSSATNVTITYSQTQCGTLITITIAKAMYKTIACPYILHYKKCCITVHYRKCGIRLHHNNYIIKCMHLESVYICYTLKGAKEHFELFCVEESNSINNSYLLNYPVVKLIILGLKFDEYFNFFYISKS